MDEAPEGRTALHGKDIHETGSHLFSKSPDFCAVECPISWEVSLDGADRRRSKEIDGN